MNFDLC